MLTPKFSLNQDAQYIYIKMHVPHLKLNEAEIHIDEDELFFHSNPYFLRLYLPGKIVEDDKSKSSYDVDSGWLSMAVSKLNSGEYFDNLDMLTKLLTPKCSQISTPLCTHIEVIKSDSSEDLSTTKSTENPIQFDNNEKAVDMDEMEMDWFIEQMPYTESLLSQNFRYGFANQKISPLNPLSNELVGMIDLVNPDNVSRKQRTILRLEQENNKFDCEHYLADYFDEEIVNIISVDYTALTGVVGECVVFSDEEKEQMLQLPRKEYIIDDSERSSVYLGIIDLLFAYAFDFRQNGGECNVESDWNICKLSSMLSWLDCFTDLKEVIISCCRRSLCFPFYRNWKFFEKVVSDVQIILQVGKSQILKCLLNMSSILKKSETRYPLVDIFLTDYCVWIQSACPKRLESMSNALSKATLSKNEIGFRLTEMECDASKLMEESDQDSEVERLATSISNAVHITSGVEDSDDTNSSEESDSYSTDCEDSCDQE